MYAEDTKLASGLGGVMNEGDDLAGHLGFQLKMLEMQQDAAARRELASFDISPARVAALMLIRENRGCSQTALGDALSINRASAMKLVNYLQSRGLVRRDTSMDLRANALRLTDEGERLVAEMVTALRRVDQQLLAVLTPEEAANFTSLVRRLRHRTGAPERSRAR